MRAAHAALIAAALAIAASGCGARRAARAGAGSRVVEQAIELGHGGRARQYLLRVPDRGAEPRALVMVLHGGGGHAGGVDALTGFSGLAAREGFVLAYPDGVDHGWNDGRGDLPATAAREGVDDVGFLEAVIDDVARRTSIDRGRVYIAGISNGAFMTSRFACERSQLVAGIGLVAGSLGPEIASSCRFAKPVAVIAFLGTDDPLVPFQGGPIRVGRVERGRTVSAVHAVARFAEQSRCGPPRDEPVADVAPDDGSTAKVTTHLCAEGTAVQLYTLVGGGHTWPGGRAYLPAFLVGTVNRDVDATATMWTFFVDRGRRAEAR